jgi:hypothetical protein
MEQNATKSALQNGLVVGAAISFKFLISALKIPVLSSLTIFISIGIVVLLYIYAKRFSDNSSNFSYGQAFGYIFKTYMIGAIIGSVVMSVYALINKNFLSVMLNDILMMYEKMNITVTDEIYNLLNMVLSPAPYVLLNLFGSLLVALFWALILAAFVKKEKSIFE